ncbi:hypothetical protein B0A48_17561 [Cryoendolithus antarcticus]|uniref:LisH domain-containing protein n=1 Tax=Cryoendolithus antarcticus TaxID=1507870 RepID=A0A1V8SAX6_9PEZI|nr:hypothetical protein B0A48_17561 [Cryoendolithus antarcticus]
MSQTQQLNMGGPVGGGMAGQHPQQQQMNAPTPTNAGSPHDPQGGINRLNAYIYEYFLRTQNYDVARAMVDCGQFGLAKQSPNSRQPNGNDDSDPSRPKDLPEPQFENPSDKPFLIDWWCQFWDIFNARRSNGKPSAISYVSTQRQAQKQRMAIMGNADPATQMGMRSNTAMINGMMPENLKKAAMVNAGNMNPAMAARMQQQQQQLRAQQGQMMQGQQMERSNSQMEMNGPRSNSPGSGDAPSPKRQRLEGNMQMRPQGQGGQMPNNQVGPDQIPLDPAAAHRARELLESHGMDPNLMPAEQFHLLARQPTNAQRKSVETYSQQMQNHMKTAMAQNQANSNMNKGMPPNAANMGPTGAQGSPLSQAGIDNAMGDYANGAMRPGMVPNAGSQGAAGSNGGNHALQDYQMQLMLLEQQNKKRLLMARQEQDSISGPGAMHAGNGQFAPNMSPQGSRAGPSPSPNDMARGTPNMQAGTSPNGQMQGRASPAPGFDPSQIPPQMRNMMVQGPGGQLVPRSHPGFNQQQGQLTQASMEMFNQQQPQRMLPNGTFPGAPQQMPPNMMPGHPGGPGQPPGQQPPNVTPRQGNMPPPPAPPLNGPGGTQPSSPAQSAAPPTPSQANKPKPGGKKDAKKGKKGGNQAAAAVPTTESEQPPTPTPATPITPMAPNSFHPKAGQPMPNGAPVPQPNQQPQPNIMPQSTPDMTQNQPFGNLGDPSNGQFDIGMDFADLGGTGGDVLDNFDFDSFLNNDDGSGLGFDNFAFDNGLEATGEGM